MKSTTLISALAAGAGLFAAPATAFEQNMTLDLSSIVPGASLTMPLSSENVTGNIINAFLPSADSDALKSLQDQFLAVFEAKDGALQARDDCNRDCCYITCAAISWIPIAGWACRKPPPSLSLSLFSFYFSLSCLLLSKKSS